MFLLENESSVRLVAFLGAFSLFAVAEAMAPRKDRVAPRAKRWPVNLALVAIDSVAVRFLTPILAVSAAGLAAANGWRTRTHGACEDDKLLLGTQRADAHT